jgi:serine protease
MPALIVRCLSLFALVMLGVGSVCAQTSAGEARVIVKLKASSALVDSRERVNAASASGATSQPMRRLGQRLGLTMQDARVLGARTHVAVASGLSSAVLAARLSAQSDVEYAVVDQWRKASAAVEPDDPLYAADSSRPRTQVAAGQWYLRAPDTTFVSAINAPTAWGLSTGSSAITVAVLDTGVRIDHPELSGNLLTGYTMISSGVIAGNGIGRGVGAEDLGDYLTAAEISDNPTVFRGCDEVATSSWHGTHVAGIIGAAFNNGVGIASVAGGVRILPVRVLGKCGGYDSDIIAGMKWAAGIDIGITPPLQAARVINLSLGGTGTCSQAYTDAIITLNQLGVVIVASAGNSNGEAVEVPANCTGVIAVGGLRHSGTKVGYSAVGSQVAISAPSGNCLSDGNYCAYGIVTTTNSGTTTPVADSAGGSTYSGATAATATYGTSFSAPQVAGAAALVLSVRPDMTPAAVLQVLQNTARSFPTTGGTAGIGQCTAPTSTEQLECYCTTSTCGAGMLDVGAAVTAASGLPVAVVTVTPSAPTAGQTVTLSGTGSLASVSGAAVTGYSWSLVDGGGIVSALTGDLTTASLAVRPSAAGTFTVRLTVTDSNLQTNSSDVRITVAAAAATTTSSGGGGGGALGGPFVLGLLAWAGLAAWLRRGA